MKLRTLIASLSVFAAFAACAEDSLIQNVAVRQLWPWSGKVNIDYYYAGDTATSVTFTATWKGQDTPVDLVGLTDSGAFNVSRGQHRFEWDPAAAGYGDATLYDFKVEVKPGADSRTYLVLDLANGGYTFLSAVPEGGWTDEYKKTKMVFRPTPAGTYTLAQDPTDLYALNGGSKFSGTSAAAARSDSSSIRTVMLSSDFYFAIFPLTGRQYTCLRGNTGGNTTPQYFIPATAGGGNIIRGEFLDDGTTSVDWPNTGYSVNSQSLVGLARALSSQTGQAELRIDLATDAQWEIAARCGTATFYPNGGTTANTLDELKDLYSAIANVKYDTGKSSWENPVGQKAPNPWGIYDFYVRGEVVLDWANNSGYYGTGTYPNLSKNLVAGLDPVGPTSEPQKNLRVRRGTESNQTGYDATALATTFIAGRNGLEISSAQYNGCVRFAIHLKPLVDVK